MIDHVIPHVPVRRWAMSLPLALRVLQVIQRAMTRHLLDTAGLKAHEGHGCAGKLIQRFGSAASLHIDLHALVLDGVHQCGADGARGRSA